MSVASILREFEAAGAVLRLDGAGVRVWYPDERVRRVFAGGVASLRNCRTEVVAYLQARSTVPEMPRGVRLLRCDLKEAPVGIDACSVVTDPALFARTALEQVRIALAQPKRWVGWTVPQLIDRLAQVGILLTPDTNPPKGVSNV